MALSKLRFLPPALTLIFSIIALVFSLLAITSKKWAVRDNYRPEDTPRDWNEPFYTLYRAPFIICTAYQDVQTEPDDSKIAAPSVICSNFRPFGHNRTSCELEVATQDDSVPTVGDRRLCQQIHYAGNFGIASTVFIGVGFLLTGAMVIMTLLRNRHGQTTAPHDANGRKEERAQNSPASHQRHIRKSTITSYIHLSLLVFLFIGFACGLISQFYGVVGFMQSSPNQADYASSTGSGASDETNVYGNHGSWYQGVALSVYATCAWAFAAAAGTMACRVWRLPNWTVST
ncbi:hypothetical protein BDW02DRAFT_568821 [Decorospora gaudefroyi]|uniref:Uncharacterized protein n=1 Tax=Decorospora gaudefroyi TaxID=184978 RepID=A0A6A5KA24_9PLEO|nr:hypothetical protein BDW02DRAFT_568821 [Decorospora gaudefroyi]